MHLFLQYTKILHLERVGRGQTSDAALSEAHGHVAPADAAGQHARQRDGKVREARVRGDEAVRAIKQQQVDKHIQSVVAADPCVLVDVVDPEEQARHSAPGLREDQIPPGAITPSASGSKSRLPDQEVADLMRDGERWRRG